MQSASAEPALGTILLVDDDLEVLDTMSEFLKIHGYATLQAQNGQHAIDLLKTMVAIPLLIVLDMSMPVLDGRGFLKRRVKDPVLLAIPSCRLRQRCTRASANEHKSVSADL